MAGRSSVPSNVMRRLLILLIAAGVAAVAFFGVESVRNTAEQVIDTGQGVLEVGQGVVDQAQDTRDAARQLNGACDLVREAVQPGTSPQESAALLQEAVAIVGGVVVAYPDVPGMSQLQGALGTAQQALAADPSGQALGMSGGAVESACSQIPSLP